MAAALSLSWEISKNPPIFNKVPPLDKVTARLGPVVEDGAVKSLIEFLKNRNSGGPVDTSVPDQSKWATFMQQAVAEHPMDTLIPIFDLFRASFVDQRVSSWFVDESGTVTRFHLSSLIIDIQYRMCDDQDNGQPCDSRGRTLRNTSSNYTSYV
jgi:hypothetical protein